MNNGLDTIIRHGYKKEKHAKIFLECLFLKDADGIIFLYE